MAEAIVEQEEVVVVTVACMMLVKRMRRFRGRKVTLGQFGVWEVLEVQAQDNLMTMRKDQERGKPALREDCCMSELQQRSLVQEPLRRNRSRSN